MISRRAGRVALQVIVAGLRGIDAAELRIDRDVPVRAKGRRTEIAFVAEDVVAEKITSAIIKTINPNLIVRNDVVVNGVAA